VPQSVRLVPCVPDVVDAADLVVVLADHDDVDWDLLARHGGKVLDTRNRLRGSEVDRL
jgi:UDP-N-acetyl-D-mannosaminuronic acid dehydrogenase/UDP-N-acetyl-D-glucosamine dehydrogenase